MGRGHGGSNRTRSKEGSRIHWITQWLWIKTEWEEIIVLWVCFAAEKLVSEECRNLGLTQKLLPHSNIYLCTNPPKSSRNPLAINSSPPGQNGRLFQMIFSDAFSWMKNLVQWLKFHWREIQNFSFMKMHFKMLPRKWWPFYVSLNVFFGLIGFV